MRRAGLLYTLCVILSLFVYARAFDNPFREDDFRFLQRVETGTLADSFKPDATLAFYRPAAVALFWLEHSWFGRQAGAYIAFNYAMHFAISILMLLVLARLGLTRKAALLGSGLFLLGFGHYGKQVMWACTSGALGSVLMTLAAMMAILPGPRWKAPADETRARDQRAARVLLAAALLLLAAAFHEGSVTACILVAFLVYTQGGDASARRSSVIVLALLPVMLAVWLVVSEWYPAYRVMLGADLQSSSSWIKNTSLARAIFDAPVYLLRYLGFMVLPVQPTALAVASHPVVSVVTKVARHLHVVAGAMMLAGVLYVAFRRTGSTRALAVWLPLALLPFTVLQQPRHHLELRYLYGAAIPLCALTAVAVTDLCARAGRAGRIVAGVVVVSAIAGSTMLQLVLEHRYDRWPAPTAPAPRPSARNEAPGSGPGSTERASILL